MKTESLNKIRSAFLVLSLLFGIGIALSTTAQAQNPDDRYSRDRNQDNDRRGRDWDRYGNYGGSSDLRRTALNAGYNEGVKEARRGNGRRGDYRNSNIYQRATKDYYSRLGDRELYKRYFREGFEEGYNAERSQYDNRGNNDDRWNRNRDRNDDRNRDRRGRDDDGYGNYGGSFQLRQTALNAGFNEGVKQGRKDRGSGDRNGFQNQNTYREATKDYSSGLGDREIYRRYFREAYEHGYADGYSGN